MIISGIPEYETIAKAEVALRKTLKWRKQIAYGLLPAMWNGWENGVYSPMKVIATVRCEAQNKR